MSVSARTGPSPRGTRGNRCRRATAAGPFARYSGMFPCFLGGSWTYLRSSRRRALAIWPRVWLGGITASTIWQLHAGECPEHGWFQTEFVSRPPREIFAVTRPFGAARRVILNGREYYSFSTAWNDLAAEEKRKPVNPLDARYWATRPVASDQAIA